MNAQSLLASAPLFRDVGPDGLRALVTEMVLRSYPAGPIVKEDDVADGLYVIKTGKARVTKRAEKGIAEAVLALLGPGDAFGELGLIDGKPRSASVSVLQPIECYFLDRDTFLSVLDGNPRIAVAMLPALAAMVRYADRWVAAGI